MYRISPGEGPRRIHCPVPLSVLDLQDLAVRRAPPHSAHPAGKLAWKSLGKPQKVLRTDSRVAMLKEVKHFYEFGEYRVDPEERILFRGEDPIPLPPKAFETLLILVQNSGHLVTKDDLMKTVWPDTFVEESNLSQYIFVLRKALGESAQDARSIVTVPGRGYRFVEKVRQVADAGGPAESLSSQEAAVPENPPSPVSPAIPKHRLLAVALIFAVVILLAVAFLGWRGTRSTDRVAPRRV